MARLKGWIYFSFWYGSILAGYAGLYCPLFPILLLSNKFYRFLTDVIYTFWQSYPTALLELCCGCDVQILGDPIRAGEVSVLVMNHRTRTDWNFLWAAIYHGVEGPTRYKHPTKFVLKDVIRHIPGIGWMMQLACFLYIKRFWPDDQRKTQRLVDYFCDISYKFSLLIFPEGTDFTHATRAKSDAFAIQNNLQKYNYVLHPRTTGFAYLTYSLQEKQSLDAVYDITLIYPDLVPQTERDLFYDGNFPREVKMHFTRYPSAILPKSEEQLRQFLEKLWLEKEKVIKEFYATGQFLHGELLKRSRAFELYISLIFWSLLPILVLYMLYNNFWFKIIVACHTCILLFINYFGDGFPEFEIDIYNLKKEYFTTPF